MKQSSSVAAVFGALLHLAATQQVTWCTEEKCGGTCESSITSSGPGYPDCVIYDTNTVFGGQGFKEGVGKIKYSVWGEFADPCGGGTGSYMVRSPASLTKNGCGDLIYHTEDAECSPELQMEETFMISFCCGFDDCKAAGIPAERRSMDDDALSPRAGIGMRSSYLKFANGTEIEPIAVGKPPEDLTLKAAKMRRKDECKGYKVDSYIADGENYYTTLGTQILSSTGPAQKSDRSFTVKHEQSVSSTTSFDVSLGDPFGIISVSVGFEFTEEYTDGYEHEITVFAGETGRVGFTPVYICTKGTLEDCDGKRTESTESCSPWTENGVVQGDYRIVQT